MLFTNLIKSRKAEEESEEKKRYSGIDKLQKQLEKVSSEMQKAINAGDIDKYNELEEESRTIRNSLVVLKSQKNIRAVSDSEIMQTWKGSAEEYNKLYEEQYNKYYESKKNLLKEFRNLIDVINAGNKERMSCPEFIHDGRADIKRLDTDESSRAIKFFDDLLELRIKTNIEYVLSGSYVEDIEKGKTLDDISGEKSREKIEKIRAHSKESERRKQILREVVFNNGDIGLIDWIDLKSMTKTERAEWFAENVNYNGL